MSMVTAVHTITITTLPVPILDLTITGATAGGLITSYPFTATVEPISATQPITYIWQASGQSPITQTGGISNTIFFSWELTGTQVITVTAVKGASVVTAVHTITISGEIILDPLPQIYLPFIMGHEPPISPGLYGRWPIRPAARMSSRGSP
jgi:hypothetical protein